MDIVIFFFNCNTCTLTNLWTFILNNIAFIKPNLNENVSNRQTYKIFIVLHTTALEKLDFLLTPGKVVCLFLFLGMVCQINKIIFTSLSSITIGQGKWVNWLHYLISITTNLKSSNILTVQTLAYDITELSIIKKCYN